MPEAERFTDAELDAASKRPCLETLKHFSLERFCRTFVAEPGKIIAKPLAQRITALEAERDSMRAELDALKIEVQALRAKTHGGALMLARR